MIISNTPETGVEIINTYWFNPINTEIIPAV